MRPRKAGSPRRSREAAASPPACRPRESLRPPHDEEVTEIDLADVDKGTGEVAAARRRARADLTGAKTSFAEGDVVFARLRPNLNNVALARRPDPSLPPALVGSSEWIRLRPAGDAGFVLVAARSSFVRAQLGSTEGQTRPRIRPEELDGVEVPDPGGAARAAIDAVVREAIDARWRARQTLREVADLYERFGRGEIPEAELVAALSALRADL
jgi:hypothetical protein